MKYVWMGIVILCFIFLSWETSFAFRCDGKIIDKNANKAEILNRCGDPTRIDEWQEERTIHDCHGRNNVYDDNDREHESYTRDYRGTHNDCVIYINMEEWFYNLGPYRLTRTIVFENNHLIRIRTGKYGY